MSEPCPLCGREKLKDRVLHPPPTTDPESYCLHPAHIYGQELPPCEQIGVDRIARMRAALTMAKRVVNPVTHQTTYDAICEALMSQST